MSTGTSVFNVWTPLLLKCLHLVVFCYACTGSWGTFICCLYDISQCCACDLMVKRIKMASDEANEWINSPIFIFKYFSNNSISTRDAPIPTTDFLSIWSADTGTHPDHSNFI